MKWNNYSNQMTLNAGIREMLKKNISTISRKNPPTPEFINIRISLKDSLKSVKPHFLPNSIVDPIQMNIVFLQLLPNPPRHAKKTLIVCLFLSAALHLTFTINAP